MCDRRRYLHLGKRFGLCVLDYVVTSNHIHLLVKDIGPNVKEHAVALTGPKRSVKVIQ